MTRFSWFLRLVAPLFVLAGLLHLVFGLGADVLLGANVPAETLGEPVLDSQNRFYGVAFTVYGVLLFLAASDLARFGPVVYCVLGVFFVAGLARLVSVALYGWPAAPVIALLAAELIAPPLVLWWFYRLTRER